MIDRINRGLDYKRCCSEDYADRCSNILNCVFAGYLIILRIKPSHDMNLNSFQMQIQKLNQGVPAITKNDEDRECLIFKNDRKGRAKLKKYLEHSFLVDSFVCGSKVFELR